MDADLRESRWYRMALAHVHETYGADPCAPRLPVDAQPSPAGQLVAFTRRGALHDRDGLRSEVCLATPGEPSAEVVSDAAATAHTPRWSPDGTALAFLSRAPAQRGHRLVVRAAGASQLGEARELPLAGGDVETFAWSPDGERLLAIAAVVDQPEGEDWMPATGDTAAAPVPASELWVADARSGPWRRVQANDLTIWEACWAGPGRALALASPRSDAAARHAAALVRVDLASGRVETLLTPAREVLSLGCPSADPAGARFAVVEQLGDSGRLLVGDCASGGAAPAALELDVTHAVWRDAGTLLVAGFSGRETVVGDYAVDGSSLTEIWRSEETCGEDLPAAQPHGRDGAVAVVQSYARFPAIAVLGGGELPPAADADESWGRVAAVEWTAPDGLELSGYLVTPTGAPPFPLVCALHGGPTSAFANRWSLGKEPRVTPWLARLGYAVFHPNPRGSSGRGHAFAGLVVGDKGGADVQDVLSGVDHLVGQGVADRERLFLTGVSYGGYLTCWIPAQDARFRAGVALAPGTNMLSLRSTSLYGFYFDLMLGGPPRPQDQLGLHAARSPVFAAERIETPLLLVAGGQDPVSPPAQARELFEALRRHGRKAALAVYPREGHFVSGHPALADLLARIAEWFERAAPPSR